MKNKANLIIFIASMICLLYILFLVYYSTSMDEIQAINIVAEMVTIPLILITIALFFYNSWKLVKLQSGLISLISLSLLLNIVCITIMFIAK
ncbi:hypothetical protein [Chryseobacterium daecheongense]|uniref:Uncharacterized protein n=1 Tax=Chryseobacterium daecheongense TaxID=192389 RepID=A0A3N0VX86_9FLAO|nr:hypothetical protein [Chryseobacterium daecheongense]ROH97436.1 hypothetical protein EGI05_08525 [Chryseobacterium daecheongense]TDX93419.1 hypothetical protein BCF50_2397 [Chryseobacterium daecheongense]